MFYGFWLAHFLSLENVLDSCGVALQSPINSTDIVALESKQCE